jgi:hypothetical protein
MLFGFGFLVVTVDEHERVGGLVPLEQIHGPDSNHQLELQFGISCRLIVARSERLAEAFSYLLDTLLTRS